MSTAREVFSTDPAALLDYARKQGALDGVTTVESEGASRCGATDCSDGYVLHELADGVIDARPCPGCVAKARLERLYRELQRSELPEGMLDITWADMDLSHGSWQKLQRYAQKIDEVRATGYNAILAGLPGRGKSQGAALVLRSAIESGYSGRMLTAAQIAQMVLATYRKDSPESLTAVLQRLTEPDFLVIDDLGAAETQSRATEINTFTQVIDMRVKAKKPTIITANLEHEGDYEKSLGFRAFERLRYKCAPIEFNGPNYRQRVDEAEVADLDAFIFGDGSHAAD